MKYAARSAAALWDNGIDADALGLFIARLESFVPHLAFSPWKHGHSDGDVGTAEARWENSTRTTVKIIAHLVNGVRLHSICERHAAAVSQADYDLLIELIHEALAVTGGGEFASAASLFDYGTTAIATDIQKRLSLTEDPVAVLHFLRSLAHDTYENQRLSYGIIFTSSDRGQLGFSSSLESKRTKALTDGFSTALVLDRYLRIEGITSLTTPANEAMTFARRPWWCSALAEESSRRNGVGVALMRSGQIIVVHGGRLQYSLRAGRWQVWNHAEILSQLSSLWTGKGGSKNIYRVFSYLYHLALDLSFRRKGGLLVVLASKDRLRKLVLSATDLVGAARRGSTEVAIDNLVSNKDIASIDRRIVAELASLDGALVVDRNGKILAYGAMTSSASSGHQGARTRAAVSSSRYGVAIKISSDGDISFLKNGIVKLVL